MNRLVSCLPLLLCLFVLVLAPLAQADNPGTLANGSVSFLLPDGLTRQVEFAAKLHDDGTTTGQMTFRGPSQTIAANVSATSAGSDEIPPTSSHSFSAFYFRAAFDCMVVTGNRAVMGGAVTESSSEGYVGRRVLLVVQDAGEAAKAATDKLTWGVYNPQPRTWTPSDAEVENDAGAGMTWFATDAERDDDAGLNSDEREFKGCRSFPLSSFSLVKVKNGDGDIQVRQ